MTDRTCRSGTRRGTGIVASVLVLMASVGALGACTDSPGTPTATGASGVSTTSPANTNITPATTGHTSAGASTSSGASTTAGPISPSELAARPDSPAGAAAFGRYVVSQLNAAYRIPDLARYDSILAPGCDTCVRGKADLEDMVKAGHRMEADMWSVTASRVLTWGGGSAELEVLIQQHRVGVIDALGRRVDENVERAGHFQLTLTRVDNSWKVAKWLNVQP